MLSTRSFSNPLPPEEPSLNRRDFEHLVRDALAHLYDPMHLQIHPLTRLMPQMPGGRPSTVGGALRRSLLDAIDSLRPPPGTSATSKAYRKYRILELRYVEEADPTEVQRQLAMSKTEYYREHTEALAAITSALREQWHVEDAERGVRIPQDTDRTESAEREVREICAQMQLEMLDLRDTAREVVSILDPLCQRQGIGLRLQSVTSPCPTHADRVGLRQALLNAIRKVMDAVAPGRVDVEVTLGANDVRVEIRGTPAEPRPPIPQQLDLTVARCLIEYLRGRVEMKPGTDVTVEFRLPTTRRARLLVVDNNQDFVALVARYLNQENWQVIGAPDAQQTYRIIAELAPDLILLDVMMPGCDGWEILRQLKLSRQSREIPVIICSVLDDEQLAVSLGADGYLLKPVSQDDLLQALHRWQVGRNGVGQEFEGRIR